MRRNLINVEWEAGFASLAKHAIEALWPPEPAILARCLHDIVDEGETRDLHKTGGTPIIRGGREGKARG